MHIPAYLCHKHYLSFISVIYLGTVLKDTTPDVKASVGYRSRFNGGCQRNDQLPALAGGSLEINPKTTGCSLVKGIDHVIGR